MAGGIAHRKRNRVAVEDVRNDVRRDLVRGENMLEEAGRHDVLVRQTQRRPGDCRSSKMVRSSPLR